MLRRAVIPIIILGTVMGMTSCAREADVPDIEADRFNTDMITVYADGYYGLDISSPVDIKDPVYIEKIVEEASRTGEYHYVKDPEEGLNTLWIDFNNGTIISMRADENYGNISDTFLMCGDEKTKDLILPEKLPETVGAVVISCQSEN